MALKRCDLELGTGDNDGTSWANAWQTMLKVADDAVAGDIVYVQGDGTFSASSTLVFQVTDLMNPTVVIGVKEGTSNETPVASDLVPGLRTGQVEIALDGGTNYETIIVTDVLTNTAQTGSATVDSISTASAGSDPTMTITVTCTITGDWANNDTFTGSHDSIAGDVAADPLTRAYQMTGTDAAPTWKHNSGAYDIKIEGSVNIYGINFTAGDELILGDNLSANKPTNVILEECLLQWADNTVADDLELGHTSPAIEMLYRIYNCKLLAGNSTGSSIMFNDTVNHYFYGCEYVDGGALPSFLIFFNDEGFGHCHFYSCDFSVITGDVYETSRTHNADVLFANCLFGSGFSATTGTATGAFRLRIHNSGNITGKTSGSIQDLIEASEAGDIVIETTVVRTGGADDGAAGLHSWAMTPNTGDTVRNYYPLVSPWMHFWVSIAGGSGATQTLTAYIANSKSESSPTNDLHDDEVWLQIEVPSEAGSAQHTYNTSQMKLLVTPSDLTNDAGSTWGSGGNNHQTLAVTFASDFEGWGRCRLFVATGDTTTVYVDPFPVLS